MNTIIINGPTDWAKVASSLLALSRNQARVVRYISDQAQLTYDAATIEVLVTTLNEQADYSVEVYGKSLSDLPTDTVGMHVALYTGHPVLIPDGSAAHSSWVLLSPDGKIENVILDMESLLGRSEVNYRKAEQQTLHPTAGNAPV